MSCFEYCRFQILNFIRVSNFGFRALRVLPWLFAGALAAPTARAHLLWWQPCRLLHGLQATRLPLQNSTRFSTRLGNFVKAFTSTLTSGRIMQGPSGPRGRRSDSDQRPVMSIERGGYNIRVSHATRPRIGRTRSWRACPCSCRGSRVGCDLSWFAGNMPATTVAGRKNLAVGARHHLVVNAVCAIRRAEPRIST